MFFRPSADNSWRKEGSRDQNHRVLHRAVVHRGNGGAGPDLAGHFSVLDSTKKNPQGAMYQGETSLSASSETNDPTECLPSRGNPCGMYGKKAFSWCDLLFILMSYHSNAFGDVFMHKIMPANIDQLTSHPFWIRCPLNLSFASLLLQRLPFGTVNSGEDGHHCLLSKESKQAFSFFPSIVCDSCYI